MSNFRRTLIGSLVLLGFQVAAQPAPPPDNPDLATLHAELKALRAEYEARIAALETRLAAAEQAADEARNEAEVTQQTAQSAAAVAAATPPTAAAPAGGGKAFNPDISIILQGRYGAFSQEPESRFIPGILTGGEAAEGAGVGAEGFALDETELDLSANIDDKFYGFASIALNQDETDTEVELEELYLQTLALPAGFNIKAGQFFSEIGYLNKVHSHAWDFIDQPLAYQGLLGNQFIDPGVQVTWLAPAPFYLRFGGEVFAGDHFPAGGSANDGVGAQTAFVDFGGDVGSGHSWQAGLSWFNANVRERLSEFDEVGVTFDGDSNLYIADLVWKWAPGGNPKNTHLIIQSEYLRREEDGRLALGDGAESDYHGKQSGWYLQSVYQFMPQWRIGMRYDRLAIDNKIPDLPSDLFFADTARNPWRFSAMLDYSNSEFSRLRLQFNQENLNGEDEQQVFLQYIMSLGAHGAHGF